VCGLEVPGAVDEVEEAAEDLLLLEVEIFNSHTVAVSAMVCKISGWVTLTHFSPLF